MTRRLLGVVAAVAISVGSAQPASAQFTLGHTDIGAVLGLGGVGDASFAFGGRFERGIRPAPSGLGTGIIGLQVSADYWGWSSGGYSYAYIPIGVTGNYHFDLQNDRLDPFLGVGLGFQMVTCDYPGSGVDLCSGYSSGIYPIGRAGLRYFLSQALAIYGDLGAGAALINAGLTFKVSD